MRSVLLILLLITASWLPQNLNGQTPKVNASVDKQEAIIGDWITLSLDVRYDSETEIEWPFLVEKLGQVDIVKSGKIDTAQSEDGKIINTQKIIVTAFDSGYYAIPGIPFKYQRKGRKGEVRSAPFMIRMETVPIDTTQGIMPIKDIMEVPYHWTEAIPYALMGLGVLLAALLSFWFWKRRKRKEVEAALPQPKAPAQDIALEKLKNLEKEKLWQQGLVKEYYSELSLISREYIEDKFDILALESTTDEIIGELNNSPAQPALVDKMRNLFVLADLAKFAKAQPDLEAHNRSLKNARDFVLHTKNLFPEEEEETIDALEQSINEEEMSSDE